MSVSFPKSAATLATAFDTILEQIGQTAEVYDALTPVTALCVTVMRAAIARSISVAAAGANLNAFYTGALATAKGSAVIVGDVFTLSTTDDTTDTGLAGAKGSALAVGDVFVVTGVGVGTSDVTFLCSGLDDFVAAMDPYTSGGWETPNSTAF
jgi:hypothetical protein